jgi:hypothetical protein
MNFGAYAILIIFGAFVLLLILNPKMSCFGKRIRSPFYPMTRKKQVRLKTTHYEFDLVDEKDRKAAPASAAGEKKDEKKPGPKTEDYGFRLR